MLELNSTNLNDKMKNGKYLLMFYTDWCPLCPPIATLLQELEQSESDKFQFARINFDEYPETVKSYGVFGVPTVLAVRDGRVFEGWAGLTDTDAYREIVDTILNSDDERYSIPLPELP